MAELLLRVHDKAGTTPEKDARCTKAGDVIVVCPDGHVWGEREKDAPFWRIVKLPNVSVSEASMWLAEEPETDPRQPSRVRHRRLWTLDLSLVPAAVLADDARVLPPLTVALSFAVVHGRATRKPSLPDPNILGRAGLG